MPRDSRQSLRDADAVAGKLAECANQAQTIKSPNQIDHLRDALRRRDEVIQEQRDELLDLYRRLHQCDRPVPMPEY